MSLGSYLSLASNYARDTALDLMYDPLQAHNHMGARRLIGVPAPDVAQCSAERNVIDAHSYKHTRICVTGSVLLFSNCWSSVEIKFQGRRKR